MDRRGGGAQRGNGRQEETRGGIDLLNKILCYLFFLPACNAFIIADWLSGWKVLIVSPSSNCNLNEGNEKVRGCVLLTLFVCLSVFILSCCYTTRLARWRSCALSPCPSRSRSLLLLSVSLSLCLFLRYIEWEQVIFLLLSFVEISPFHCYSPKIESFVLCSPRTNTPLPSPCQENSALRWTVPTKGKSFHLYVCFLAII